MSSFVKHGCLEKQRYAEKSEAEEVAKQRMRQGAPKLRAYHCTTCNGYHITKQQSRRR